MPGISLCMIVKNEENTLERCLTSIQQIIDEIIIVDTGSTDKTKEIAKKFTDKIFDFKWNDNFSDARNYSISKATKEWILILDADETIAKQDLQKIKQLTTNQETEAYQLTQRNYTNTTDGTNCENDNYKESKNYKSYHPSKLVRLFKNKQYKFQNRIHELIEDSIKGKIEDSNIPIHHLKNPNKDKTTQYMQIQEKQIQDTPENPKPHYEIAKLYQTQQKFDKALEHLKKAEQLLGTKKGLLINKLLHLEIGITLFKQQKYEEALKELKKATQNDPQNPWPQFYTALILHEQKQVEEAKKMYEETIKKGIKNPIAYANLAEIQLNKKEYKKAHELLTQACQLEHPNQEKLKQIIKKIENIKVV